MKYLLILNFSCKVHKNYPNIKIFADNSLVDDFELTPSEHHKWKKVDISEPKPRLKDFMQTHCKLKSSTIRYYIIDGKYLKKRILLKLDRQDNNYTNGFSTSATVTKLGLIGLVPLNFIKKGLPFYQKIFDQYMTLQPDLIGDITPDVKCIPQWPFANVGEVEDVNSGKKTTSVITDFFVNTKEKYVEKQEEYKFGGTKNIEIPINCTDFGFSVLMSSVDFINADDEWMVKMHHFKDILQCQPTNKAYIGFNQKFFTILHLILGNKYLYEDQ